MHFFIFEIDNHGTTFIQKFKNITQTPSKVNDKLGQTIPPVVWIQKLSSPKLSFFIPVSRLLRFLLNMHGYDLVTQTQFCLKREFAYI
jgi:hypothetical protein